MLAARLEVVEEQEQETRMSYKKNAVSYGIWALYLMGVGIVLSFMGMVIGSSESGVPYMALILLALSFGILFLVYFLAKKIVDSVKVRGMAAGRAALAEGLLVTVLLAVGVALRVRMIGSAGEEAAYYDVAKVTENGMQLQLVQGSIYYYLCLLNGFFRLVGNKWMAGIVLQTAMQFLGIVIGYFAVRRLSGRGAALVSLAFLTLAPGSVKEGLTYSPKMLYFCIYVLILFLIAQYLWRSTRPGGRILTWILAVLCGALVGFAGYTDIVGFTLVIPLCGVLTLRREQKGVLCWVLQFLLSVLSMAGTFCLLVQTDSSMSGSTFERVWNAWIVTYGIKGADYGFFFQEGGYETIVLLVLMGLGIFTFMRRKSEEIFSPWVVTVLSVMLMRVLGITTPNMNGSYQMFFAMTGLAGVALSELFVQGGGKVAEGTSIPETVVEDLDAQPMPGTGENRGLSEGIWPPEPADAQSASAALAAETFDAGGIPEEAPDGKRGRGKTRQKEASAGIFGRKKKRQDGNVTEEGDGQEKALREREEAPAWEPLGQASGSTAEVRKDMAEKKREESPGQVQYIENPLPLPKKHVKKVMDYPIQPDASQMHYDVEVDPKDNFDF